ncbi:MAG TPA: ABC transporter ATP-binding protein [Anaerolineales bacterium]
MNGTVIHTENLTRYFHDVHAVDGITFEVPAGIVFGFLGPNGSGKTTTIRLLLGLLEPTSGRAEVLGFDTRNQPEEIRQRSGALLEHTGLYERLTAEDNLEFYGRVWRLPASERRARIQELLNGLGLWDRRRETVGNWSRGQKQKLAVARTLLNRPALVFLDEPTAGLDPVAAAALREDLAGLAAQQGVTVFLTTHNLPEAEKLCEQVAVIRQGKLLAIGSPDELRRQVGGPPRLEVTGRNFSEPAMVALRQRPEVAGIEQSNGHISIQLKNDMDTAPLVQLMIGQGVAVEEVSRSKASLEDVFLDLMEEEK